jgi:hypothetical protein|tara:strand:+ start:616 stop:789 length:174 start_codon:yes stop_codon:yes gene_type:complete
MPNHCQMCGEPTTPDVGCVDCQVKAVLLVMREAALARREEARREAFYASLDSAEMVF